ncbi:hypothetical protein MVEN_02003700 [Mycena venus]|uniref:Carboxylic ester hydrolase n=1 Tax=Mycena venus TaxID=2733690 RepID=A0A8H6XDT5_9AGAR|nr:hypothetical protein MVEN_02003700 [Mycena venus]
MSWILLQRVNDGPDLVSASVEVSPNPPSISYTTAHSQPATAWTASKTASSPAPLNCSFDPATLACPTSASSLSCLSASQLATARAFYSGAVDPVTHEQLYPGFVPGSELTWAGEAGIYEQFATAIFENTWAMNLSYDPLADFNFHTDVKKVHDGLGVFIDANSPDLRRFHARGGKLIVSQSLADTINPQKFPLDYYTRVQTALGGAVDQWFRLFHVPGAHHCGGGPGPNYFDPVPALVDWFEAAAAPNRIVASKFNDDEFAGGLNRSMPLCPWPKIAMPPPISSASRERSVKERLSDRAASKEVLPY